LNPCVERMLEIARQSGTPLFLEVVKSIASICGVDPYELWNEIAKRFAETSAARHGRGEEALYSHVLEVPRMRARVREPLQAR